MAETFDPSLYLRPPVLDVPTGIALAQALLSAQPKGASPDLRKAGKTLDRLCTELKLGWDARETAARPTDRRRFDQALDGAWGRFHDRLLCYSALPVERNPAAAHAGKLYQTLFPDGLSFLKLSYEAEWSESQRRLDRINKEGWDRDLDRFCGSEFLAEVRHAHKEYGEILGITKPAPATPLDANLRELLRQLSSAMSRYTLKILAGVDDEDPASVQTARQALRPYDDFRAAITRRQGSGSSDEPAPADAGASPPTPPESDPPR